MDPFSDLFSSPPQKKPGGEYSTPVRAKLRGLYKTGWTKYKIIKKSKLPKSSVYDILGASSSRRTRKGKVYKPRLMLVREVRRVIRHIYLKATLLAGSLLLKLKHNSILMYLRLPFAENLREMDIDVVLPAHGLLFLAKLAKVALHLQKGIVGGEHQTMLQIDLEVVIGERCIGPMNAHLRQGKLEEFGLHAEPMKNDVHLV